jgi:hypothetical protein
VIHGEHGYRATQAALEELKSILKALGGSPKVNLAEVDHLRRQIKDMELELSEYELHHLTVDDSSKKD